jgi:hypothetical protein
MLSPNGRFLTPIELRQLEVDYSTTKKRAQTGQAGRRPLQNFLRILKKDGFLPTVHFAERFLERVAASGATYDPHRFKRDFLNARHYRQTERKYLGRRYTVVNGIPVVYRMGGRTGRNPVLITIYFPYSRPPKGRRTARPDMAEAEAPLDALHAPLNRRRCARLLDRLRRRRQAAHRARAMALANLPGSPKLAYYLSQMKRLGW